MSENENCSANGCPMFGTVKSGTNGEGGWYCMCHFNREPRTNDDITSMLRRSFYIVDAVRDIRCSYGRADWGEKYRNIQKILIQANRRDLLLGQPDESPHAPGKPIVRQWLARLEGDLMRQAAKIGRAATGPQTVATAPVIGLTHAATYFGEVDA